MSLTVSTFPDTTSLWSVFATARCSCHRGQIIATYLPMVRRIAGKMHRRLPGHADLEDVVSYGNFGLIHAVDVYEPGRCGACGHMHFARPGVDPRTPYTFVAYSGLLSGPCRSRTCPCGKPPIDENHKPPRYRYVKFETVAAAHIRGRILDEFRVIDWAPRSVRRRQREVDEATEALESKLGREPTPHEIAGQITKATKEIVTAHEVISRQQETDSARVRSLDEPVTDDGQGLEVEDPTVAVMFANRSLSETAATVFASLSPSKRLMLALRYYEQMPIVDIAGVMGLEPARASQLHAEAVITFRDVLASRLART